MCTALFCCAGSAICCASATCCEALCCCCKRCGMNERSYARVGYVVFSIIWVILGIVIMFFAPSALSPFDTFIDCSVSGNGSEDICFGISTIYRISFLLAVFHVVLSLFGLCGENEGTRTFHDGCWPFKFLLILACFIITLFIPNSFFQGYGYFAQVVSIAYLLYQVLALVSFAYLVNDKLVGNYEEGSSGWGVLMILLTVLFYGGALTICGFLFYWFHECASNIALICVTLGVAVVAFILVIIKTRPDSSVLTSSLVFFYTVYLVWSAMGSRPDPECNKFIVSDANTVSQIVFGLFFAVIALLVTSAVTKRDQPDEGGITEKLAQGIREEEDDDPESARKEDIDTARNAEEVVAHKISRATMLFHVVMMVASVYYAMVLTNWGNPSVNNSTNDFFGVSWLSFWVKIASQWAAIVLYLLTLLVPLCFKRDYA